MNFEETAEFKKDVKALKKRVPTLIGDIKRVKPRIEALYIVGDGMTPDEHTEFRKQFFEGKKAAILPGSTQESEVIKLRLDTDTTQYRKKLRLVFVAVRTDDTVRFIEIYAKNDKTREDTKRYKSYL